MHSFLGHTGREREKTARAIIDDSIECGTSLFSTEAERAMRIADGAFLNTLEAEHKPALGEKNIRKNPSDIYGGV